MGINIEMLMQSPIIDPDSLFNLDLTSIDSPTLIKILVGAVLLTFSIAVIFSYTLIRSQEREPHNSLIAALSLLTFIALTAAVITSNPALETIAATGIGAIAGAVSQAFSNENKTEKDNEGTDDEQ